MVERLMVLFECCNKWGEVTCTCPNCAPKAKELAATDSQHTKGKIIAFDVTVSPVQVTIEVDNVEGIALAREVAITAPVC